MADRLPDGWGPDTPTDDNLLRAYAEAYADMIEAMGRADGGATARTAGFVAFDNHAPFPFFNAAMLLRPVHSADDPVLDEIAKFFAPDDEGTPYLVMSVTPLPPLQARGWQLMGHPPLMLRPAAAATVPEPDGLEIVGVRDEDTLAEFEQTLVEAFPAPGMEGRRLMGGSLLDVPGWHMWLGRVDGRGVATAGACINDGFVDVEWISTRPEHRGRRIGEAITWSATLAARDRPAMLLASDAGQPVYERMGYLRLARMTLWVGTRGGASS